MVDLQTARRRLVSRCAVAGRATIRIFLASALAWCVGTMAAAGADLYRAQAVVTGEGEANRIIGFAACLEDVLIKVSGAHKLAGDRRLAAYKSNAKSFVKAFSYHDQFSGKPKRDEQGTRDRPYDLTVDFEESKIDGILKALGLKPWLSHRPLLAVLVEMKQGPKNFIVTADGTHSDLQRDALLAAADRRGMGVVLPSAQALAKLNLDGADSSRCRLRPWRRLRPNRVGRSPWSGSWFGMIGNSDGPRIGRWTGKAGCTGGKFAASHSTKPSDAVSVVLPRCLSDNGEPGGRR